MLSFVPVEDLKMYCICCCYLTNDHEITLNHCEREPTNTKHQADFEKIIILHYQSVYIEMLVENHLKGPYKIFRQFILSMSEDCIYCVRIISVARLI